MKRELSPETASTPYVAELRRLFWEAEALMRDHMKLDLEATQVALTQLEGTLEAAETSIRLGLATEWPAVVEEEEPAVEEVEDLEATAAPVVAPKKELAKGKKR